MLNIEEREGGVVALAGRFDAAQVEHAEQTLDRIDGPLVLDLAGLDYIASAGIGVVLRTYKRLRPEGHELRLVNAPAHIRNIFHYAGLDQILDIE